MIKLTPAISTIIQDKISIMVNNMIYHSWTAASVSRGIENPAGSFQLSLCENSADAILKIDINEYDKVVVLVGITPIMTGFIDKITPSYDAEQTSLDITGRSKTAHLVDCSAINSPGQWRGQKAEKIIEEICTPFDISVKCEVNTGATLDDFQLQQGETCWDAIERICRLRGLLAYDDEYGNLILSQASNILFPDTIFHEFESNLSQILSASAQKTGGNRYSDYIIKGQAAGNDEDNGINVSSPKSQTTDASVPCFRPLLIVSEGQNKTAGCKKRAEFERASRAGQSLEVQYTIDSWTSPMGHIWQSNRRIAVIDDYLKVNAMLLISEINWSTSLEQGAQTQLILKPPYAFLPEETEPQLTKAKNKKAARKSNNKESTSTIRQNTPIKAWNTSTND